MDPRSIEDSIARDVLGWTFVKDRDIDFNHTSGPGWYKSEDDGTLKFMGWPDPWATNIDAMWKLAGQMTKQHMTWNLTTKKDKSIVKLSYLPYGPASIHSVEAEAGLDEMPLAMCLALLKMVEAKKAKTADGLKTV